LIRQLDGETQGQVRALEAVLAERAGGRGWSPPKATPPGPAEVKAAGLVPNRLVPGGMSLGKLPPSAWPEAMAATRGQNPRWSRELCCALYWADGRRTLLEIRHLAEQELGSLGVDLFEYFYFLERHGYIRFSKSQPRP
jgi:hypothetical protein